MTPFSSIGFWQSKNFPKNLKLAGTLEFSPENFEITLIVESNHIFLDKFFPKKIPLICGNTLDGHYTLVNSWLKGSRTNMSGVQSITYQPYLALKGIFASEENDLKFDSASLEFDDLLWFFPTRKLFPSASTKAEKSFKSEVNNFDKNYELNDGTVIRFWAEKYRSGNLTTDTTEKHLNLGIKTGNPIEVNSILNRYIFPLQKFFSLAIDRYQEFKNLTFYTNDLLIKQNDPGRDPIPIPVEAFIQSRRTETKYSKFFNRVEFTTVFEDVEPNFVDILNDWFVKEKSLGRVINSYYDILFRPNLFVRNQFLNIASALEGYHVNAVRIDLKLGNQQKRFTQNEIRNNDFKKLKKAVLSNCNENYKSFLKLKLASNSKFFATRLNDLFKYAANEINQVIGEKEKFISDFVKLRNELAHGKPSSELDEKKLYILTYGGRALFLACIRKDIFKVTTPHFPPHKYDETYNIVSSFYHKKKSK